MQALVHVLDSLAANTETVSLVADLGMPGQPTADDQFLADLKTRFPKLVVKNAASTVMKLRAYKSEAELALIKRAAGITVE